MTTKGFVFVSLLLMGCSGSAQETRTTATIDPADDAQVELTLAQDGKVFKLYRGAIFRKHENGKLYRVGQKFSDDFEDARTIHDLIGVDRGWTASTLQSPKSPTVEDYVRLRKRILTGQRDFFDNRIEPSGEVWFAGWYYVPAESGMPFTLMDLETTWFKKHPGIRTMVFGEKYLGVELKWGAKPTYRQPKGRETAFPRAQWVHVKFHITLSEKDDGVVELWQDGTQIVDARGQTLPLAHSAKRHPVHAAQ